MNGFLEVLKYAFFPYNGGNSIYQVGNSFIDDNWRPWKSVLDEASTDIEIDPNWDERKMKAAQLRIRKEHVVDRVYSTCMDEYIMLVDFSTGKIYYYLERDYGIKTVGKRIYLIDYEKQTAVLIYDEGFLMNQPKALRMSKPRIGRKHYLGIEWSKTGGFRDKRMFFRDHQIIAIMYFGTDAVNAIGVSRKYEVNHRNLYMYDNRPENLEIVTKKENKEHAKRLYRILNELVKRDFGLANGEWLHMADRNYKMVF